MSGCRNPCCENVSALPGAPAPRRDRTPAAVPFRGTPTKTAHAREDERWFTQIALVQPVFDMSCGPGESERIT